MAREESELMETLDLRRWSLLVRSWGLIVADVVGIYVTLCYVTATLLRVR